MATGLRVSDVNKRNVLNLDDEVGLSYNPYNLVSRFFRNFPHKFLMLIRDECA